MVAPSKAPYLELMPDERRIRDVCVRSSQLRERIQEERGCFAVQHKGLIEEAVLSTPNPTLPACSPETFYISPLASRNFDEAPFQT